MLIAGSLLTFVFSGLAVDGFMKPVVEDDDEADTYPNDAHDDETDPQKDPASGLSELLFPDELETVAETNTDGVAFEFAPATAEHHDATIEQTNPETLDAGTETGIPEQSADPATDLTASADVDGMVEVDEITALQNGADVAYVDGFEPATDSLVLEFDGTADNIPDIAIDHEVEDDAAVVTANGTPVALIEGGQDMQADHVRVVMSGIEIVDPLTEADATGIANEDSAVAQAASETQDTTDEWAIAETDSPETVTADFQDNAASHQVIAFDPEAAATEESLPDNANQATDDGEGSDTQADRLDTHPDASFATVESLDEVAADAHWVSEANEVTDVSESNNDAGADGADEFAIGAVVEDAEMAGSVSDFNPIEDRIEVLYDSNLNPDPVLQVLDFSDGTGADIVLNGEVILSVSGAQGLAPEMIELRSVA